MKQFIRYSLIFYLLLLGFQMLPAQAVVISEGTVKMDKEKYMAAQVLLEPDKDAVKDAFEEWLRKERGVNLKKKGLFGGGDMLIGEEVTVPSVSAKSMDFYAQLEKVKNQTQLSVYGMFGYDFPITPEKYPNEFRALKELVREFTLTYLPEYYTAQVEEMREMIEDLRKEEKDMRDQIADNEKTIEKMRKENENLRQKIEKSLKDLAEKEAEMQRRESSLKAVSARIEGIN